jgi:hypothetical protein
LGSPPGCSANVTTWLSLAFDEDAELAQAVRRSAATAAIPAVLQSECFKRDGISFTLH